MHKPAAKREQDKPPIVGIKGESGDEVEPPPPELLEPDPELTPEEAEQARKDYLLTRFWISARGFWGRSGDRLAWPLSLGLVVLIVLTVGFQYGINVWNRAIFDAIEKRDAASVFHLTALFFPLAIGSIVLGVAQVFARMGIQRRWRAWLTSSVLTRWLKNGRYYQLNLVGGDHENTGSRRTSASPPILRSTSWPASPPRSCPRRPSSSCSGPSAARSPSRSADRASPSPAFS